MATKSPQSQDHDAATIEVGFSRKESIEESTNIVDFDGPQDPQNPMNWSSIRKFTSIAIISSMTFVLPLISTIIAPGTEDVMKDFKSTSGTLGSFVTTAYVLGGVGGPIVIAPCSELYGRSIVYQVCSVLFFIFNLACAVSNNLSVLITFRFFAGFVGSCSITIGAGSIGDMIAQEKRAAAMAGWAMGPIFAPSIGPIIGAYLTPEKGWRWIFWISTILTGVTGVLTLFLKESYPYIILNQKTARLRKETGNPDLRSALDLGKTPRKLFVVSITRPLKMLFFSPTVFIISLYVAIVYAYIYICFTTIPRVFQDAYQFSLGQTGLAYLGIGVGSVIGLVLCGATMDRISALLAKQNGGQSKPEFRLPTIALGAFLVPAGLFWYGWTAENQDHWILPIIGTAFIGAGMNVTFMSSQTYLVDAYTVYSASAIAASTILRSLLGALLPLAGSRLYDDLGVGWGTSLLGFIAVAFIPISFGLYTYGERIREYKLFHVEF